MKTLLDGVSVFINNWQLIVGIFIFMTIFFLPLGIRLKTHLGPVSIATSIFLALGFFLTLHLRLAYVSQVLLPSYFDSASHYALIKNITSQDFPVILESLRMDYYHLGFHFISAFFTAAFQMEISRVMLIFGQITLAVLPLPFFFIVRYMTRSVRARMFAAAVSTFGWYMPAHAVDWGKYPALLSIYMLMVLLSLVYFFAQNKDGLRSGKRVSFFAMVILGVLFTTFIHSRTLIVLVIIATAWAVSIWWGRLPQIMKQSIFVSLLLVLGLEVVFIQGNDVLNLLFDPYLGKGIVVTALVVALSVLAYKTYPQLTFVILITIILLLVSIFISLRGLLPGRDYLTLMDRPYVEMILFMPLSVLGGLGLAGLERRIKYSYQRYAALAAIGLILLPAFVSHEFYPSDCCVIVGNDDVAAMAWMADQLPADARIGIASTKLNVVAGDVAEGDVGADAGIWITPLMDRVTILLPSDLEFHQQAAMDMICIRRLGYIFVGELGQNFNRERLDIRREWYRPLLSMSGTRVYEVIGCN